MAYFQATVRLATLPVLICESGEKRVEPRSCPYIGQSVPDWHRACGAAKSAQEASRTDQPNIFMYSPGCPLTRGSQPARHKTMQYIQRESATHLSRSLVMRT